MFEILDGAKERILDILLPKFCVGCGREGLYICKDCEIFLSEVYPEPRRRLVSVWEYEGLMEKLILKIKYDGCYDLINELVEKAFKAIELNLPEEVYITFVPMYKKREKRRGFNQAALIAQKVGEKINGPVVGLLEKTKDNRSQVGLNPQERVENVKGVFSVFPLTKVKPQSILLVDDVYTTGATMAECTKVLKKAGIKNIYEFTLARKLRI